jgi:hypothetical protein
LISKSANQITGFERPQAPSPPPPRKRETRETDIDIYTGKNGTEVDITNTKSREREAPREREPARPRYFDDSAVYESERDRLRVGDTRVDINRSRSVSSRPPPPRERERERSRVRVDIRDDEDEAEHYSRKASERAYIGEAYNGATKHWAIVDVPPGTERVRMDGVGGGSEEITWQRYNGVRRSKFIPDRERMEVREREPERDRERERIEIRSDREPETRSSNLEIEISSSSKRERKPGVVYERDYERIEENTDRRLGPPREKPRVGDGLWTEITKDLVVREAIERMGYPFEETEFFYYVLTYLRYVSRITLASNLY